MLKRKYLFEQLITKQLIMKNKTTLEILFGLKTARIRKQLLGIFFAFAFLTGTFAQTLKVINAGGGGDYTSLNAAITDINAIATPTAVELQIASDLIETLTSTLNYNTNLTSLKIYPTGAARSITAPGLSLLTISTPNVTIDGSLNGTGAGPANLFIRPNPASLMANSNNLLNITGVTATPTIHVIIKYCNIYDFSNAIMLNNYVGVTIDHNSFYSDLSAGKNGLAQQNCIIMANGPTTMSDTLVITNNCFGGSAPLATGSWVRDSLTSTPSTTNWGFYATYFRATSAAGITHRLQGNVVKNVVSQTQKLLGGRGIYGFFFRSTNVAPFNIKGNTISDLTYQNDASNSSTADRNIVGIRIAGNGAINISDNQIYNFDNQSVQTGGCSTAGISWGGIGTDAVGVTPITITNNLIHDIKSTDINNGGTDGQIPSSNATITSGIIGTIVPGSININSNTVYNISNYNPTSGNSPVVGILVKASVDATLTLNNVRNNIVYGLSSTSPATSSTAPYIIGLGITSGNANCYNNAISVGENTQPGAVVGILKYTDVVTSNSTFYFNTVYVGGTTVALLERISYAFLRLGLVNPTTADVVKNNIFYNLRSGALNHYAIGVTSSSSNFTSDNNELYSGTNLGTVTATNAYSATATTPKSFTDWQTAVSGDATSKNITLTFTNAATDDLHTTAADLKGTGVAITGITTDLANATRTNPPSIGAYEQVAVAGITVAGAGNATIITTNGGTLQMTATIAPANAANQNIFWSVTNGTGGATINGTGILTATANGRVTVRATAQDGSNVYGELVMTISGQTVAVTGITVAGVAGATTITTSGGTLQMTATIAPVNATNQNVTWTETNDTGGATIGNTGLLTATKNGTVTIRATAQDGSNVYGEATITISGQGTSVSTVTDQKLFIYPNPAVDIIIIDNASDVKQYAIISLTGQVLLSGKNSANNLKINVNSLASGTYILKLYNSSGSSQSKFVKK